MYLEVEGIHKHYGKHEVLKGISFSLNKGESVAIEGSSGSGKSTLLYTLGTLEKIDKGSIRVDGQEISSFTDKDAASFRNQTIGFIFQFHFLLPSLNCWDNIILPLNLSSTFMITKEVKNRIKELASFLKVEHCLKKYPFEISGGEQQRINIIRAVVQKPSLLLCDEPTGNLDSKNTESVMDLLLRVSSEVDASLIVVTHDAKVSSYFDRKITIEDGLIIS